MDIFFAVNDRYAQHVCVAMHSVIKNNEKLKIHFHILGNNFSEKSILRLNRIAKTNPNVHVSFYPVEESLFSSYQITIPHITCETYFRYIIPELCPHLDKALYLDADVVVKGDLSELWNTDLTNYYCGGVFDTYINDVGYKSHIGFSDSDLYVNAGVLLLNLKKIRTDNKVMELFENTGKLQNMISYQDQDIINITFKGFVKELPQKYNYTFRDVVSNSLEALDRAVIVHFTGDKKPWDCFYSSGNPAEIYYYEYLKQTPYWSRYYQYLRKRPKSWIYRKTKIGNLRYIYLLGNKFVYKRQGEKTSVENSKGIRVALLVDEFFGGAGTAYGGYGFLARNYIAKYLPNENIKLDLLLGFSGGGLEHLKVDNTDVYRLPKNEKKAKAWLKKQSYDVFLSVELTSSSYQILKLDDQKTNLVLWVQDPRPWYEWREIFTVKLFPETCYWDTPVYEYVNYMNWKRKVRFITQAEFLVPKARDLYRLSNDLEMQFVPNPIDFDKTFDVLEHQKKNQIIFLGRIESVKRGWLFCEIAKRMPEYDFYLLGQTFREQAKNSKIIDKYKKIPNLHFVGHVEGKKKEQFLKDAKILVNTSIHEALPISFLEALSYGTLLVSNRNPESLTSKFGVWVGDVLGDGLDQIDLYVAAIRRIMANENDRIKLSRAAVEYVRNVHNTQKFIKEMRGILIEEAYR